MTPTRPTLGARVVASWIWEVFNPLIDALTDVNTAVSSSALAQLPHVGRHVMADMEGDCPEFDRAVKLYLRGVSGATVKSTAERDVAAAAFLKALVALRKKLSREYDIPISQQSAVWPGGVRK